MAVESRDQLVCALSVLEPRVQEKEEGENRIV